MGSKSSPPPAPDYTGAAKQSQLSQMSSQYTPYGSQVYKADPTSPSGYQSTISLAPQAQSTLDTQMGLSKGLAGIASGQLPQVQSAYSKPMELGSVNDVYNKAYGAQTERLDPQWQALRQQEETKLTNQGLRPGGEAYDNAMRVFNQGQNDAYRQAELSAIQTMPQTYQLASAEYQQPLNIFNALRTGAQIQNPQFGQQPGANYLGAAGQAGQYAGDVYNSQVGQKNALMQGLFGLGSAGIMAAPFML